LSPSAGAASLDWDVPGGHFFTQAGGGTGRGYVVSDEDGVAFWTAFQTLGGVPVVGYPVSQRFSHRGFVTQAMQKAVFQWRPESGSVAFVNVFDDLSGAGKDDWLLEVRSTPRPAPFPDEAGKPFGEVSRIRQAALNARPAMRAIYFAANDPVLQYGLPTSRIEDMGNHYAIRLQRAVIQEWKIDVPWAAAGQATVANGGDIAKEGGLWPSTATVAVVPDGSPTDPVAVPTPTTRPPEVAPTPTATSLPPTPSPTSIPPTPTETPLPPTPSPRAAQAFATPTAMPAPPPPPPAPGLGKVQEPLESSCRSIEVGPTIVLSSTELMVKAKYCDKSIVGTALMTAQALQADGRPVAGAGSLPAHLTAPLGVAYLFVTRPPSPAPTIARVRMCLADNAGQPLCAVSPAPVAPTCVSGFVWREAFASDYVCVSPQTRTQAAADNSQAATRRNPSGGAYGPDTCLQGFVWRDASPRDHVCVTGIVRSQAAADNAQAPLRVQR
jgi:hypothetical protein